MATIYHNPACSTSRKVLALPRAAGIEWARKFYLSDATASSCRRRPA